MDDVKKLLGDDLYNQVAEKIGDKKIALYSKGEAAFIHKEDETPIVTNNGSWIPKDKFQSKIDEIKTLKQEADDLKGELAELKKTAGNSQELQAKITDLENKLTANDQESKKRETATLKKFALKDALRDNGAKYPDLLVKEFNLDEIELDEKGKIKDLEGKLKPVKENFADVFGEVVVTGKPPKKEKTYPDGFITKEQFDGMNQKERVENVDKINESLPHWDKE